MHRLEKDKYCALGTLGVLGVLFGAAMGFIAVPTWGCAMMAAILAIPGALVAGVLYVLQRRRHGPIKWSITRIVRSFFIIVGVLAGTWVSIHYVMAF